MYDGRDLGISDCAKMRLGYPAWAADGSVVQGTDVHLVNHTECTQRFSDLEPVFPGMPVPPSPVSSRQVCVKKATSPGEEDQDSP